MARKKFNKILTFAIDFDGTLAEHKFPIIGAEIPGAVQTCQELMQTGYKLVLNTVRSDQYLEEAKAWCLERGLNFYGWNNNPDQKEFSSSPKVYADIYIDDAALGCPLTAGKKGSRPFVNWAVVHSTLVGNGIL
jgi:hypothetical protein